MTHSTHFIYGYMVSDMLIQTCCSHYMGYSFRLAARVLLYAHSHKQDCRYHNLCYTCLEREIAQWVHHEELIWHPITPWLNTLPQSYFLLGPRNGSIMRDRSNDLSHHEWMLYHGSISRFRYISRCLGGRNHIQNWMCCFGYMLYLRWNKRYYMCVIINKILIKWASHIDQRYHLSRPYNHDVDNIVIYCNTLPVFLSPVIQPTRPSC